MSNSWLKMTSFAVVEFPKYEVEVVSSKWLTEDKNFCMWPKHLNMALFSKALADHSVPDRKWKEYPVVKHHGTFGKYQCSFLQQT